MKSRPRRSIIVDPELSKAARATPRDVLPAQPEVLFEVAKLVLTGEPVEIARQLRASAEQTIRPK